MDSKRNRFASPGRAREETLDASIPSGQQLVLNLPVEGLETNREYEADICVALTDRAPVEYHGMVSCTASAGEPVAFQTKLEPLPAQNRRAKSGEVLADSVLDYGKDRGVNNWNYGYSTGPDDFQPMKFSETVWGYVWRVEGFRFLGLNPEGGHPGLWEGKPIWAVRRWTSTVDGPVRMTGRVSMGQDKGDGGGGEVVVDGVVVWSRITGGQKNLPPAECDVVATVKKGSTVDFAITPGPVANIDFDACSFTAQIARVAQ